MYKYLHFTNIYRQYLLYIYLHVCIHTRIHINITQVLSFMFICFTMVLLYLAADLGMTEHTQLCTTFRAAVNSIFSVP